MPILQLKNISKSFGALKVADAISFSVPTGQALGIIGPNGAGKSTMFNLVCGAFMPDSGQIILDGKDISRAPAIQRCISGIGRSFQIPQPFDNLTVFENLLVAGCFGQDKSEEKVTQDCVEILEVTGLLPLANSRAGGLGLLERKRLELARAMATNPKLLLLDEIAGGLTDGECRSLIETIKNLNKSGVTIIWIEHVLHALTAVVERLLVLDFGKIIGIGKPDDIMNSPEVRKIYLGVDG